MLGNARATCPTWTPGNERVLHERFEKWESYVAGRLGFAAAVDYALSWSLDAIQTRADKLADKLRHELRAIPGVHVHDLGQEKCAIVTFTHDAISAADVKKGLREQHINVSVSVLDYARLDFEDRGLEAVVHASPQYYNTDDENSALIERIARPNRGR